MTRKVLLISLLMTALSPHAAVTARRQGDTTGQISGIASVPGSGTLSNATARLRDLATKEIIGTTTTNASGQFVFVVTKPGEYIVEIVNEEGAVVGTTAAIALVPGRMVASTVVVAMTSSGSAAAAGGAGPSTSANDAAEGGSPSSSTQSRSAGTTGTAASASIFSSTAPVVSSAAASAGSGTGTVPSRGTASPSQ